jgi:hypothetical protein
LIPESIGMWRLEISVLQSNAPYLPIVVRAFGGHPKLWTPITSGEKLLLPATQDYRCIDVDQSIEQLLSVGLHNKPRPSTEVVSMTKRLLPPSKDSNVKAEKALESPGLIELGGITLSEDTSSRSGQLL